MIVHLEQLSQTRDDNPSRTTSVLGMIVHLEHHRYDSPSRWTTSQQSTRDDVHLEQHHNRALGMISRDDSPSRTTGITTQY